MRLAGLRAQETDLRLFNVCVMARFADPRAGLATSCQRRARNLQRIAQPVLTRLVPQPQGIGAVVCSISKNCSRTRYKSCYFTRRLPTPLAGPGVYSAALLNAPDARLHGWSAYTCSIDEGAP